MGKGWLGKRIGEVNTVPGCMPKAMGEVWGKLIEALGGVWGTEQWGVDDASVLLGTLFSDVVDMSRGSGTVEGVGVVAISVTIFET